MAGSIRLLVALVVGASVSLGLALAVSAFYFPVSTLKADLKIGAMVFEKNCSSCHAVEHGEPKKMGPDLYSIGLDGATRKPDTTAAEYILESILHPDAFKAEGVEGHMPPDAFKTIAKQNMRDLVAFLASKGATPDIQEVLSMEITYPILENRSFLMNNAVIVEHGRVLFTETLGCTTCHSVFPDPGNDLVAPSLSRAGQLAEEYIAESLREPGKFIAPGYKQVSFTNQSGVAVYGRLIQKTDTFIEVMVQDKFGHYDQFKTPIGKVTDLNIQQHSMMPPYKLSLMDEKALVSFLRFITADG
jgi:putative heme-binding domain-containing protein